MSDTKPDKPAWLRNREACFAICNAFSLTRGERLEFAATLLDRNVDSWSDLDARELNRLRDALVGAVLVCTFQIERRKRQRV